jgi:hypothetical protein
VKLKLFAINSVIEAGSPFLAQAVDSNSLMPERTAFLKSPGATSGLALKQDNRADDQQP